MFLDAFALAVREEVRLLYEKSSLEELLREQNRTFGEGIHNSREPLGKVLFDLLMKELERKLR